MSKVRKYMPSKWSQDKYIKAYRFAAEAHNGQLVPGTTLPYIVHISLVAMEITAALAVEPVDNPDLAIQAALLHDTIEDTDVIYEEIEDLFGTEVARGVMALTIDESIGPDSGKFERRWLQLEDYLRRIKQQPREIWMVKMADRITNLQPPPDHWDGRMIERYREGAELIYKELGVASMFLGERLRGKIDQYPTIT